ncbi:putative orphan protein [Pseudoalteromonas luteoviolacea B = ATCC 29581]|nr:putative orphan protein [Pseudoalteromonas luteoviolacea B = ATCC 29581]
MTTIDHNESLDVILVTPSLFPEQEDVELWATVFLHHAQIKWIELHVGADRYQVRFKYQNEGFALNYDYYSQSIWITPEGLKSSQLLANLSKIL